MRIATLIGLFSVLLVGTLYARDQREEERIAALLKGVESTSGVKFIRNGSEYDGKAAADHLRLKLRKAGERVKTAEDFIAACASGSSISGKKYRIRLATGEEMDAEIYFRQKLKEIDRSLSR